MTFDQSTSDVLHTHLPSYAVIISLSDEKKYKLRSFGDAPTRAIQTATSDIPLHH